MVEVFRNVKAETLTLVRHKPYSTCHNNTRRVKLRNLPRRVDLSFLSVCPGGLNSNGPKSDHFKELFALLDFCSENHIFVMTISTISMRQNCSISFSADPEGTNFFSANLLPTRYNYDMWSTPPGIIIPGGIQIRRKGLGTPGAAENEIEQL